MARTKEFDPAVALEDALGLFWERGYEATSMADLVKRLGVARASLYATFGDKHELYVKALVRYAETQDPDPVQLLSQPGPALPAVKVLLERYAEESIADRDRRGCMMVNAAAERLPLDRQVARVVESSWDRLEAALTGALVRARAQGELAADVDPSPLARFLLVVLQGIRVMGKSDAAPQRLRDAAAQALRALR